MKPEEQLEIDIQLLREFHRANHIERLHKALESVSNISELCEFLNRELTAANERIKRLEEAGDAMAVYCDDIDAENWKEAKEAKP